MTTRSNHSFNHNFDPILTYDDVAKIFGRSKKSIWRWVNKEKSFPSGIKVNGRTIGWRQSTIENFLDQQSKEVA